MYLLFLDYRNILDSYILENYKIKIKIKIKLCSFRWLKPKHKWDSFNPWGSEMLKILFSTGWIKNNNLLLKIETDSEFLILTSRLSQSFWVQWKNEYLKQSVLQLWVVRCLFIVLKVCLHLEIKTIR